MVPNKIVPMFSLLMFPQIDIKLVRSRHTFLDMWTERTITKGWFDEKEYV
jgi:hypothetical protein